LPSLDIGGKRDFDQTGSVGCGFGLDWFSSVDAMVGRADVKSRVWRAVEVRPITPTSGPPASAATASVVVVVGANGDAFENEFRGMTFQDALDTVRIRLEYGFLRRQLHDLKRLFSSDKEITISSQSAAIAAAGDIVPFYCQDSQICIRLTDMIELAHKIYLLRPRARTERCAIQPMYPKRRTIPLIQATTNDAIIQPDPNISDFFINLEHANIILHHICWIFQP
jgi:hypothetical protein